MLSTNMALDPGVLPQGVLLAIETSTLSGSVALLRDGILLGQKLLSPELRRTGQLLPAIRDLYRENALSPGQTACVAFSAGPGSFTGLRTGATVARMFHSVLNCPVVATPSLAVIAAQCIDAEPAATTSVATVIDARGGLVYAAEYRCEAQASPQASGGDDSGGSPASERETPIDSQRVLRAVVRPGAYRLEAFLGLISPNASLAALNSDAFRAGPPLDDRRMAEPRLCLPQAATVAKIGLALLASGRVCERAQIVPTYLRPPECEEVYEARRAAARARRS